MISSAPIQTPQAGGRNSETAAPPALTVAICAHNAEQRLALVLDSLATTPSTAPTWELLVIDNASTDATSAAAQTLCEKHHLPLRLLHEPEPGLAHARRRAACEARAEIMVFLDDDNIVPPDYLPNALRFMRAHPDAGIVGALVEPVFEDPAARPANFQEHFAGLLSMYDQGAAPLQLHPAKNPLPVGAGMVGRRDLFRLTFDEIGSLTIGRRGKSLAGGEDLEAMIVAHLIGWELWYTPDLRLGHYVPTRKLTEQYREKWMIDTCCCHAWILILRGDHAVPSRWGCVRKYLRLQLEASAWLLASFLPKALSPKLQKAALWSRMFRSMAAGWKLLLNNYGRVRRTFRLIETHRRVSPPSRKSDA